MALPTRRLPVTSAALLAGLPNQAWIQAARLVG